MKYYTYVILDDDNISAMYVTKSEKEILEEYWEYWYNRMCHKFGKEVVDTTYSSVECIEDWVISNWAWESEQSQEIHL